MKKNENKGKLLFNSIVLLLAIVLVATIFLFGNVKAKLGEDSITLKATFVSQSTINYDEIESVVLSEDFDIGKRSLGIGGGTILGGSFNNTDLGSYRLFCYANVKTHIIIKTATNYYVYNLKTTTQTQNSYNALLAKII